MPEVRAATRSDLPRLSLALSRAFADDPVFEYLFGSSPSADQRRQRFFELTLPVHLTRWEISIPSLEPVAAAVWAPPGRWRVRARDTIAVLPGLLGVFGPRGLAHLVDYQRLEHLHARHAEPHYYLAVLGTDPDHRGRGLADALMRPVLERCDVQGLGAYLESSKESNLAFYGRYGFEVVAAHEFHRGGPTVWPMWRPPR